MEDKCVGHIGKVQDRRGSDGLLDSNECAWVLDLPKLPQRTVLRNVLARGAMSGSMFGENRGTYAQNLRRKEEKEFLNHGRRG